MNNFKVPNYYKPGNTGVGDFSKFNCACISAHPIRKFDIGTVDGRNVVGEFTDYNGISVDSTSVKISRVQKKERGGYHSQKNQLGQVNSVSLGFHKGKTFLFVGGTIDAVIYNLCLTERAKDVKPSNSSSYYPVTASCFSPNYDTLVYASGTDWNEGIDELNSIKRPKIIAIKISNSDLDHFIKETK